MAGAMTSLERKAREFLRQHKATCQCTRILDQLSIDDIPKTFKIARRIGGISDIGQPCHWHVLAAEMPRVTIYSPTPEQRLLITGAVSALVVAGP